jgi:hypothetical protein
VIVVLMFLAGIGLAWLLSGVVGQQIGFERKAQRVLGRVVALQERPSGGKFNTSVYAPVFRFATADGQSVDAIGEDGSDPPAWKIGETSQLLYDPARPSHVAVDTLRGRWGSPLLMVFVSLSFFAAGTLGLRTRRWRLFQRLIDD